MTAIEERELMALLEIYCDPGSPVLPPAESQLLVGAVTPADCLSRGKAPPMPAQRPMFSGFALARGARGSGMVPVAADSGSTTANYLLLFRRASRSEERGEILIQGLASKLARAMSIAADGVVPAKQRSGYGVDSPMAVELRNWIARDFGASVPVFDIMGGATIADVRTLVAEKTEFGS
ncbi:polyketide synthase [Apiospora saccharicola]